MRSIEIQRRNFHFLKWMELIRRYSFHSPLSLSNPSSIQLYCRRVCQLGKLFISSKTLVDEVETFLFYILVEHTNDGCEFVGYFSKVRRGRDRNEIEWNGYRRRIHRKTIIYRVFSLFPVQWEVDTVDYWLIWVSELIPFYWMNVHCRLRVISCWKEDWISWTSPLWSGITRIHGILEIIHSMLS